MDVKVNKTLVEFLSNRPLVESAEKLTRIPQSILKHAEQSAQDLVNLLGRYLDDDNGNSQSKTISDGRPLLKIRSQRELSGDITSEHENRKLLLSSVSSLLEQANLNRLAVNSHAALLSDELNQQRNVELMLEYENSVSSIKTVIDKTLVLNIQLNNIDEKIKKIQCDIEINDNQISQSVTVSVEHQNLLQEKDALLNKLASAQIIFNQIKLGIKVASNDIENLQNKINQLFTRIIESNLTLPINLVRTDASNISKLLDLMSELGDLILKAGDERSETQREILKSQEMLRFEKMLKDAEKADKEAAKAEEMNKAMGCIGKILGGLITAIAFIGAIFTGGASLVIAAVGLALIVADEIYKAATGESFIQEALKPLMKLVQPLLKFFMDKLTGILSALGVDDQTAKIVSMVVVSLAIAAVVVAVMVTGAGSAIANVVSKVLGKITSVIAKILEKTLGKIIPEIVRKISAQTATKISSATSQMIDGAMERLGLLTDTASRQIYGNKLGIAAAGMNLGKISITGGLEVAESYSEKLMAKLHGDIKFNMSELDLISEMLKKLFETLGSSFSTSNEFFRIASKSISQYGSVGSNVARSIGNYRSI